MHKRSLLSGIVLTLPLLMLAGAHSAIAQDAAPAPQAPPASSAPAVKASPEDTAKTQIQATYDVMDKAITEQEDVEDNDAVWKHFAPDFVTILPNAKAKPLTLNDLKASLRRSSAQVTNRYGRSIVETIKLQGDTATVEVTETTSFTMRAQNGSPVGIRIVHHDRDFWVKKNNDWLLKRSRILDAQSEADGKPINMLIR